MTTRDLLLKQIAQLPEHLLGELLDFAQFLKAKAIGRAGESAMLSESSLSRDWLRPEEDEAWTYL